MKRFFVGVLIVVVVILGWVQIRNSARIGISAMTGKFAKLGRDDLTIPIEASGTIEPEDRIEIKSEASGSVEATPYEVGQMVRAGDVIVKLNPEDEERMLDRAEKAVGQARINLLRAKATLEQRKHDIPATEARLEQNNADLEYWTWRVERWEQIETGTHEDEIRQYRSNKIKFGGMKKQLEAQLSQAERVVELGELDVQQAEISLQQATTELEDAKERLAETTIVAPENGMLARLLVKKGSVIASGSMSLTGGTPLAVIANIDRLYVRALVDEADIGRVFDIAPEAAHPGREPGANGQHAPRTRMDEGTPVEVTVEAYPEETFTGFIELIEPEPQQNPGDVVVSYAVRIRLDSKGVEKLQLGMQANVRFISESVKDALLVPNEAVYIVAGERGVYTAVKSTERPGELVPKFKPFDAGLDDGMNTQVLDGLEEGATIYLKLPMTSRGERVRSGE